MKKITLLILTLMLTVATAEAKIIWDIGYPDPSTLKAEYDISGKRWEIRICGEGAMRDFTFRETERTPEDPDFDPHITLYWHWEIATGYFSFGLVIEEGVTTIGERAFSRCIGFDGSLTIPESVTTIGTMAFAGCSGFSGTLIIPTGVTTIGQGAFEGCRFSEITISENVTTIGRNAFANCGDLTSINNYSKEPQNIDRSVFSDLTLSNITLNVPVSSLALYQEAEVWKEFKLVGLYYKIKATAGNNEHGTVSANTWYELGNSANLTAIPAKDYEFVGWTKDGVVVSTENPYIFPVTEDAELVANFQGLTVSLNDAQADNIAITGYYSLLGEKLPQVPQSGVYIVMYANGKTEKIVRTISK